VHTIEGMLVGYFSLFSLGKGTLVWERFPWNHWPSSPLAWKASIMVSLWSHPFIHPSIHPSIHPWEKRGIWCSRLVFHACLPDAVEEYHTLAGAGKQMTDHIRGLAEYFMENPNTCEVIIVPLCCLGYYVYHH